MKIVLRIFIFMAAIELTRNQDGPPAPPTDNNQDYEYPDEQTLPTNKEDQNVDLAPINQPTPPANTPNLKNLPIPPTNTSANTTSPNVTIIVQQFIQGDTNINVEVTHTQNNQQINTNIKTTQIKVAPKQNPKQPPKQQPKKKVKKAKKKTKKQVKCIPCNNHARCKRQSKQLTVCYPVKCQGAADAWKGTCGAPWKPAKKAPKAKQVPVCPKTIVSNGQRICRVNKKA